MRVFGCTLARSLIDSQHCTSFLKLRKYTQIALFRTFCTFLHLLEMERDGANEQDKTTHSSLYGDS